MRHEISPTPVQPVDRGAQWVRLMVRERRTFRDFCRQMGDDGRAAAYQSWIGARRQMMATPAPDEAALVYKIGAFLRQADMQSGQGVSDICALCRDLWRLADLEPSPSDETELIATLRKLIFTGRCTDRAPDGPQNTASRATGRDRPVGVTAAQAIADRDGRQRSAGRRQA